MPNPTLANNQQTNVWWKEIDSKFNDNQYYNPNNEDVGVNPDIIETMSSASPMDFYTLFVNDVLLI